MHLSVEGISCICHAMRGRKGNNPSAPFTPRQASLFSQFGLKGFGLFGEVADRR
jgi:hypothetical protein